MFVWVKIGLGLRAELSLKGGLRRETHCTRVNNKRSTCLLVKFDLVENATGTFCGLETEPREPEVSNS